jgi:hypothetical protein
MVMPNIAPPESISCSSAETETVGVVDVGVDEYTVWNVGIATVGIGVVAFTVSVFARPPVPMVSSDPLNTLASPAKTPGGADRLVSTVGQGRVSI